MPALVVARVVRQERSKAIQVVQNGQDRILWLPKSQIVGRCPRAGDRDVDIFLSDWLWGRISNEKPDSQGNWVSS